jgi:hypothetical protein
MRRPGFREAQPSHCCPGRGDAAVELMPVLVADVRWGGSVAPSVPLSPLSQSSRIDNVTG